MVTSASGLERSSQPPAFHPNFRVKLFLRSARHWDAGAELDTCLSLCPWAWQWYPLPLPHPSLSIRALTHSNSILHVGAAPSSPLLTSPLLVSFGWTKVPSPAKALELILMHCSGREALAKDQFPSLSQKMSSPSQSIAWWMFSPLSTNATHNATQMCSQFRERVPPLPFCLACWNSEMANNY